MNEKRLCEMATIGKSEKKKTRTTALVIRRTMQTTLSCYTPQPMIKPELSTDFEMMTWAGQVAETCRYTLSEWLYAISPQGGVQAWWRLCVTWLAILLPTFATLYILGLGVVYALYPLELAALTATRIFTHLGTVALISIGIAVVISAFLVSLRGFAWMTKNEIAGILVAIILLILLLAILIPLLFSHHAPAASWWMQTWIWLSDKTILR